MALLESARRSKTLKDGLSGPLSIASLITKWTCGGYRGGSLRQALESLENGEPLHIVVVGASAVYEEVRVRFWLFAIAQYDTIWPNDRANLGCAKWGVVGARGTDT